MKSIQPPAILWKALENYEVAIEHFISTHEECLTQNPPFYSLEFLGIVGLVLDTSYLLTNSVYLRIPHFHSLTSFIHSKCVHVSICDNTLHITTIFISLTFKHNHTTLIIIHTLSCFTFTLYFI